MPKKELPDLIVTIDRRHGSNLRKVKAQTNIVLAHLRPLNVRVRVSVAPGTWRPAINKAIRNAQSHSR